MIKAAAVRVLQRDTIPISERFITFIPNARILGERISTTYFKCLWFDMELGLSDHEASTIITRPQQPEYLLLQYTMNRLNDVKIFWVFFKLSVSELSYFKK